MLKSRLLLTEQPVVINKELATVVGLNEAIVLQQIEYWININEKAKKESAFHDGFFWTYNTVSEWQEQFPFWSYDTVKRTLSKLRKKEILITDRFNKEGYDRTLWYRINYKKLNELEENLNSNRAKCTNEVTSHLEDKNTSKALKNNNRAKCTNAIGQNALMQQGKMPQPIPEINTKTSTEITGSSSKDEIYNFFESNICELKKTTSKKFIEIIEQHDLNFVQAVIEECTLTNVKSYKGFATALNNYLNAKCTNAEEVHQYAKDYSKKKNKSNTKNKKNTTVASKNNTKKGTFNNFEQRDYNFKELEEDLTGWYMRS